MSRQLRPDTFDKQLNHQFRQITKLSAADATIRSYTGPYLHDDHKGFQQKDTSFRAIAIHGASPPDTRIALINYYQKGDQSIKSAIQVAQYMAEIRAKTLNERQAERDWPTLGKLAQIYADMAAKCAHPITLRLPSYSPDKFEMRYPRIDMSFVHYATSIISFSPFNNVPLMEIEADAAIIKRLRKPVVDRTTISANAMMALASDEHQNLLIEKLIGHETVKIGPFTLANHKEDISIQNATWHEGGMWLEYIEGTLSIRGHTIPTMMLDAMVGHKLEDVVSGIPLLGQATILRTSNPKNYVMQSRPRDPQSRNDAPTLRIRLENKKTSLRKAGSTYKGERIHQAISEADAYAATIPGPHASKDAAINLASLIEIAQNLRLMTKGL